MSEQRNLWSRGLYLTCSQLEEPIHSAQQTQTFGSSHLLMVRIPEQIVRTRRRALQLNLLWNGGQFVAALHECTYRQCYVIVAEVGRINCLT